MNLARIMTIARLVLWEHARERLLWLALALAAALAAGVRGLEWLNFGLPRVRFLVDGGLAVVAGGGLLVAVMAPVTGLHRHLDSGLAAMLLARGVRRGEFLAGHWAGAVGLLAVCILLPGTALLAALAATGEVPTGEVLGAVAQAWLRCVLVAAVALALGTLVRGMALALCLALLVVIAGFLRDVAGPVLGSGGWVRGLTMLVPDLAAFDTGRTTGTGRLVLYALAQCALWLGLAYTAFRRREL